MTVRKILIILLVGALAVLLVKSDWPTVKRRMEWEKIEKEHQKVGSEVAEKHNQKQAEERSSFFSAKGWLDFIKNNLYYVHFYQMARCCQLWFEWEIYYPWRLSLVPPMLAIIVAVRFFETQLSWHLLTVMFLVYFHPLNKVEDWHERVAAIIYCFWGYIDILLYYNISSYEFFYRETRKIFKYHKERGLEAEQKIMTHAVTCYNIYGRKISEIHYTSEVSRANLISILACFKKQAKKAKDEDLIWKVYSRYMQSPFELGRLAFVSAIWEFLENYIHPAYIQAPDPTGIYFALSWDYWEFYGMCGYQKPLTTPSPIGMITEIAKYTVKEAVKYTVKEGLNILLKKKEDLEKAKGGIKNLTSRVVNKSGVFVIEPIRNVL